VYVKSRPKVFHSLVPGSTEIESILDTFFVGVFRLCSTRTILKIGALGLTTGSEGLCSWSFSKQSKWPSRRYELPADRTEPETYTIDDTIRVPIALRDEDGVAHVRAIFRRMRRPGNLGPRGLDPDDTLELRGNGSGQRQATVEATLKVADEHEPGDYLCVAIQTYDSKGNMVMIKEPKPSKLFRIADLSGRNDRKARFLGWGD